MIEDWKAAMKKEPTVRLFREVTQAFKAAVATTKGEGGGPCRYKVADSAGKTAHFTYKYWYVCQSYGMLLSTLLLLYCCQNS